MNRREIIAGGVALAGTGVLGASPARPASSGWVRVGEPGWPSDHDWAAFGEATGGRLQRVSLPDLADPEVRKLIGNPYYIGEQPGLTQSSGWLDAWRSNPSVFVVAAESAADVAAAIGFARAHNVRLVVRGGAHSYLGCSNAPDSLMIWTKPMRQVTVHEGFTPAASGAPPVPAVSAGSGSIWLDVYQAVTNGAGRYVQGGGCTTVGVTGLVQGGGFGSFSKRYGTAASSLLEAEVVTADGKVRVVNASQDPDLFWALKGGGGGTFGVITRLTLATHELPSTFGAVRVSIHARSDEAYRRLLARFVDFYATTLCNPTWGEQARAQGDNTLVVEMVFQGLTSDQARATFKPLVEFADASPGDYHGQESLLALALPARMFWDAEFWRKNAPFAVTFDRRPGAPSNHFWWAGNSDEVGVFWHAYKSAWLPGSLLQPRNQSRLVEAWFQASRHWSASFHFNKGLAGAPPDAIAKARETATNPEVLDAFALVIIAGAEGPAYQGMAPKLGEAKAERARIDAAMNAMLAAAPGAGAYVNECDYFQPNWRGAFWGENYPRLLAVKRRFDPGGLFTVHHCVGSEDEV